MSDALQQSQPVLWYAIADMRINGVPVIVRWGFWEGRVVRFRARKGRGYDWITYHDGKPMKLPPRGKDWAAEPDCWRPEGKWPIALPTPLDTRWMVQDVDCIAEMDNAAKQQRSKALEPFKIDRPWWHEAHPAFVAQDIRTPKAIEYRLLRAVAQLNRSELNVGKVSRSAAFRTGAEQEDIDAMLRRDALELVAPRFQPNEQDVKDFTAAMEWFATLQPPEERIDRDRTMWSLNERQWVLFYRSRPIAYTWEEIADLLGLGSYQNAQYYYRDTIARCWRVANGGRAYPWKDPTAAFKEVRERNRARRINQPETAVTFNETNWRTSSK